MFLRQCLRLPLGRHHNTASHSKCWQAARGKATSAAVFFTPSFSPAQMRWKTLEKEAFRVMARREKCIGFSYALKALTLTRIEIISTLSLTLRCSFLASHWHRFEKPYDERSKSWRISTLEYRFLEIRTYGQISYQCVNNRLQSDGWCAIRRCHSLML